MAKYRFYEMMQKHEDALAIFNNNNYCFCLLFQDRIEMHPFYLKDALETRKNTFPIIYFDVPLKIKQYRHVGYCKTYQECKAVFVHPWYMMQEVGTKTACGFETEITGEPVVSPPLSIYKELLKHPEYKGVYLDSVTQQPVFIN